jgi:2-phosphosulfolactate phosphatase
VKVEVAFTAGERGGPTTTGRTAVVLDVLRATSSIVEALVNGARRIIPAATVEEAVAKKNELGRDAALLCGERGGRPIRGFDLGNSPLEFTPAAVSDKTLVMSTTNGTPALLSTAGAGVCLIAALLNIDAVAQRVVAEGNDVLILCAGREGRFAIEDAVAAGVLTQRIRQVGNIPLRLDDGARAAITLAGRSRGDLAAILQRSVAGRSLRRIGQGEDILFCSQLDRYTAVPVFEQHRIELS